jgi:hypothetical protein
MTRARDLADSADKDIAGTVTLDDINLSNDITLADNGKAIFGAGSDLQIYHDGSNSFISDQGTGNLKILADDFRIRNATDTDSYIFVNSGAEVGLTYNGSTKLATTSSGATITGSLGIGTSSPSYQLQIENTTNNDGLLIGATSNTVNKRIVFAGASSVGKAAIATTNEATFGRKALNFYTNSVADNTTDIDYANPRMIITNSGKLLVGKTSDDNTAIGLVVNGNGYTKIVRASATANVNSVLSLNRLTSDGDITVFQKDGTAVGSIGSHTGDIYIASATDALKIDDNARPASTTGGTNDAAMDLGTSGSRWKDLYLSGVARVEGARIGPSSLQTATITGLNADASKCITGNPSGGEFVAYRVDNAIAFDDFIGAYLFGNDDNTSTEDHFCGMWAKGAATSGTMDMFFAAGNTGYETDTPQMTLKSSGFLGVGTNVPSSNLHVEARTSSENCGLRVISGTSNVSYINLGDTADNNICSIEHDNSINQLKIYTNNGVAMALDISKRVSVNSTSSTTEGYVHRLYLNESGTGATSAALGCRIGSTATRRQINFMNPNGIVGRIQTSGTATSYVTSSDYRLKENVVDITDGIERVKQLSPKRFNFIADADLTVDGFIAHETQTVVPEAIDGVKDETHAVGNLTDAAGEIVEAGITEPEELQEGHTWTATGSEPVYQGIDQSKIVPVLTAALKEAIAKIEALETRLTALEG